MLKRLRTPRIYLILLLAVSLFGAQFAHAANTSPIVVGTIPDKTLEVNGTYTVDLSGYFNDGDGDTLTYTANSGDTTIATVSVSTATLTVTAVAVGSVTIEATATDPDSEEATQEFTVTVQTANTAPTTVGTMDDHELLLGGSTVTVEASLYFTDEDVEALSYAATSSDTAVATLSVSGAAVTVNHVGAGTATITVTATDAGGLSATQSFSVTVTANQAPTVVTIPAQVVAVNGGTRTLDLDNYFSDADGQSLIYTASSSDTGIATVSLSTSNLTITGNDNGTATVTVSASDSFASVSQTISVTTKSPPTTVGTIPNQSSGVGWGTITVDVSSYFSDPDGQALTYSASSSNSQLASASVSSSDVNIFPISPGTVTITVTATNPDGLSVSSSFSVTLYPNFADAIPGLSSDEQLQLEALLTYDTFIFNELYNGADDANDYLELRNVSDVDLPLDAWELTILTGSGNMVVGFPAGTVIPAGEVLLLVNTAPTNTGNIVVSSVVDETFALPQEEFALILRGPATIGDLAGNYLEGEIASSETTPTLAVDTTWHRRQPIVSGYLAEAWSTSTTPDGLGTPGYRNPAEMADLNNDGVVNILDLVLVASQFGMKDTPAADLNNDGVVNIQDLVVVANALGDVAAAPTAQQSTAAVVNNWLHLARQNATGVVQTALPEGFSYERGILVLEQLARTFVPETTALLANYPNPFNPETWIPYQLAKAADVTVRIYAADGSVVRTLVLGHQDAGMYHNRTQAAYWDGTNAVGETVASGLYFYTLTAGDFTATRKMLILK